MKKLITVILTAVMLGACGGKAADPTPTPADAPTPAPAAVPTANGMPIALMSAAPSIPICYIFRKNSY